MPASCTTEGYGVYGLSGTGGTWVIIPADYSHYSNRLGASYSHGLSLTSAGSFPVKGQVCSNYGVYRYSPTITQEAEIHSIIVNSRTALLGSGSISACPAGREQVYGVNGTGGTWLVVPSAYAYVSNHLGARPSFDISLTNPGSMEVKGFAVCACIQ
ncbi:hypothetical protein CHS0354_006865 [Potamilus streckersoni]|uniref:Uncharacterized protein n=1 Tax=Potamilus streckersoni TaxID=2493646 RepID=A0AAE0TF38_9BIVA|nr:hypothetical protein CHS0354_006865 [Potamilus streckersoni]